MEEKKRILGIDENGLGPLLGPLVVTGTLLKQKDSRREWFEDITDSKMFFKTRSMQKFSLIEETAISLFYLLKKRLPLSPLEIFSAFCGNVKCSAHTNICTNRMPSKFLWADPEKTRKRCSDFAEWSENNSINIESVHSAFICPLRLNRFTKTDTKLFLDFLAFCHIIQRTPSKHSLDVQAGKIGGLKFYLPYFKNVMPDYMVETITEKNSESIYSLSNKGVKFMVGFFMGVEQKSFSAAISSIAGKYIRELSMFSIRENIGIKENISGYHDSKTMSCINGARINGLQQRCVFRIK